MSASVVLLLLLFALAPGMGAKTTKLVWLSIPGCQSKALNLMPLCQTAASIWLEFNQLIPCHNLRITLSVFIQLCSNLTKFYQSFTFLIATTPEVVKCVHYTSFKKTESLAWSQFATLIPLAAVRLFLSQRVFEMSDSNSHTKSESLSEVPLLSWRMHCSWCKTYCHARSRLTRPSWTSETQILCECWCRTYRTFNETVIIAYHVFLKVISLRSFSLC